ncbi:MAG: HAMP domain-containing sensor histidine kinase [Terrisporobacter sp.]|uniref:two-component system sensor histidine kinase NtrB n=1 Tax=Terrisporobacter sp. TaxID=1965305 RepID=UPI002FC76265
MKNKIYMTIGIILICITILVSRCIFTNPIYKVPGVIVTKSDLMEKTQSKWFGISGSISYNEHNKIDVQLNILIVIILFLLVIYLSFLINYSLKKVIDSRTNELKRSRNELQAAFDVLNRLVIIVNSEGIVLNVNKSFCNYNNSKKEYLLNRKFYELDPLCTLIWNIIKFNNNEEITCEINYDNKFFEIYDRNISDEDNSDKLIMIRDITRDKISEKQMMQSNKMAAVGHLAAGVAHEIRNPLGIIRNYCYLLKHKRCNEENYEMYIENIEFSVERAGGIIDNLLKFSSISGDEYKELNIKEFFNCILDLEKKSLKEMNIGVALSCEDILINTNEESLKHIFINLISNSIDAMPEGGIINIMVRKKDHMIEIEFSDSGIGIEKKDLDNLFNPFFTTKSTSKGTGLGLYIVYNEIKKLEGDISITSSEVNKGTTFKIEIPTNGGNIS